MTEAFKQFPLFYRHLDDWVMGFVALTKDGFDLICEKTNLKSIDKASISPDGTIIFSGVS